jgi:hypothetical protein
MYDTDEADNDSGWILRGDLGGHYLKIITTIACVTARREREGGTFLGRFW